MENETLIFMQTAIELAENGMNNEKGGPFGSVVVKDGKIVGRGCNEVTSRFDPTAHGEMQAIRDACKNLQVYLLHGCEIYTSCEPCPMCLSAMYWARIDRIYFGATRKDAARIGFIDDFIYKEFSLPPEKRTIPAQQLLHDEADAVFKQWENKHNKKGY